MTYQPEVLPGMTDIELRVASFAAQAARIDAAEMASEADRNAIAHIQDRVWHDYHEDVITIAQAGWLGIVGMLAERPGELHTKQQFLRDSEGELLYPRIERYEAFFLSWKFAGQSKLEEGTVATVTTVNAHLDLNQRQMTDVERALEFASKPPRTVIARALDRTLVSTSAIVPPKLGVTGKQRKLDAYKSEIDAFMLDNIKYLSIQSTAEVLGSTAGPKQIFAMKVSEPENLPRPDVLDPEQALQAKQRFLASRSLGHKMLGAVKRTNQDEQVVSGKDVVAFEDWLRKEAYKNKAITRITTAHELLVKSS